MQLTVDFGYPRLRRSRGGRGKFDIEADYLPGDRNDKDGLHRLVDMRRTTRGVGAGGRAGDEGGGVDGGEEEYGSQITSLAGTGLHILEALLHWLSHEQSGTAKIPWRGRANLLEAH